MTDLSRIEDLVQRRTHEAGDHEGPFSIHVLGLGKTGANVVESFVRAAADSSLSDGGFSALAIDIGDGDLAGVRDAAKSSSGQVRTVALPALDSETLFSGLRRYREYLKAEFPRYYWNPNYEPWLPNDLEIPAADGHFDRALSKAIYGVEYYQGHEVTQELDAFVAGIQDSQATPIVCVVFSLAGGTGSGIVVDLARHLSNIKLGRRPWVLGMGVLPCDGDPDEVFDGRLFPAINELDCMVDAEKNQGVMTVWGDLYKNPFTAGFFAIPQNAVYERTGDLEATHKAVDAGLAAFLVRDGGKHVYESIKALNWLNVDASSWHPAIRGEQSDRWLNLLAVDDADNAPAISDRELVDGVEPPFAEVRWYGKSAAGDTAAVELPKTRVDAAVVTYADASPAGASAFVPKVSKLDLRWFAPTRDAYDTFDWEQKLMAHSWILDLGVLLCEPSTRFESMGGECLLGCACWVVVPHAAIRGEELENVPLA
ncbi:tubulin-like doman-containing protein [Pseudonocardia sulfidoxydans]|uniref:tubulin-like doman-containing protein n=1 Tax=Pseudonocardia sulfidoxydans TaxID=54011 RepID=UPI001FEBCB64|nr:tubulin-like doman-containing protein [Pseudonocardia sulfidoxydans]